MAAYNPQPGACREQVDTPQPVLSAVLLFKMERVYAAKS